MGLVSQKNKSNSISALKKELLDTQDMAAKLFEQSAAKDQQILDLQTMVAQLVENGGKA
jgi:hypothetical protein